MKHHMCRNTDAYQSLQLNKGAGAYKRVFLTHKNAVTTAVKRVAGKFCTTESDKMEVLRDDLEQNVRKRETFWKREKKEHVDIMPYCKQRLLRQKA